MTPIRTLGICQIPEIEEIKIAVAATIKIPCLTCSMFFISFLCPATAVIDLRRYKEFHCSSAFQYSTKIANCQNYKVSSRGVDRRVIKGKIKAFTPDPPAYAFPFPAFGE